MTEQGQCDLCHGEQWLEEIRDEERLHYRCVCTKQKMMRKFLGPEISRARHIRSDLFLPELDPETNKLVGDRTLDNLFLRGTWSEVAAHLRWALSGKKSCEPKFSFRMTSDVMVLRVYLGEAAYTRKSTRVRDDIETFNNLSDLVHGCSLLIVRLGVLGYRNKAAPGALKEALNLQLAEAKPTWIIEGDVAFECLYSYNDEVGNLVRNHFEEINLGGDVEASQALRASLIEDTVSLGPDMSTEPEPEQSRYYHKGSSRTYKNRWRKGNTGSGLPEV